MRGRKRKKDKARCPGRWRKMVERVKGRGVGKISELEDDGGRRSVAGWSKKVSRRGRSDRIRDGTLETGVGGWRWWRWRRARRMMRVRLCVSFSLWWKVLTLGSCVCETGLVQVRQTNSFALRR